MNLPNKLTLLRIILIPFFVFFLLAPVDIPGKQYIALGIFAFASLTDLIDGKIARKYNLVTNFGKFMDPIADKLLVSSAMIAFVQMGLLPAWMVIIIIAREFIISGFRLVASDAHIFLQMKAECCSIKIKQRLFSILQATQEHRIQYRQVLWI